MMVDLEAPKLKNYSEDEKKLISGNFILLLHTLLLIYLTLHNLIIPLVNNLLKDQEILGDVHFWFLTQIPVQFLLRSKRAIPKGYFLFLLFGSLTRLLIVIAMATTLKSWSVGSMLISEGSSFIFYFVYHSQHHLEGKVWPGFIGILIPLVLQGVEVESGRMPLLAPNSQTQEKVSQGCEGDQFSVKFPVHSATITSKLNLIDCGFEHRLIRTNNQLSFQNNLNYSVDMRLYKLHILYGRVSWRFVRLLRVPAHQMLDLTNMMKSHEIYLLKSPERAFLGMTLIIPESYEAFPLGAGELKLTSDTVGWFP